MNGRFVQLTLLTYGDGSSSLGGQAEGETELQRNALGWVAWRKRTGQIGSDTAQLQRYVLTYFAEAMRNRKPGQVGESDLERWLQSMNGLAPGTVRQRWRIVYCFLEWLVDEGKIRRNPARRIPTPKVPRAVHRNLRPDQATALHDACIDSRERLIVALGFQLGMRRAEIAGAEVGDIDFVERSVKITGKGGHERVVPVTECAMRAVVAYLAEWNVRAGPLVRDWSGQRGISPDRVGKLWQEIAYRAGVKTRPGDGIATHSARHTAGTDVAHRTGDAVIVRDFLGHANLSTTDRYVGKVDLETQRAAIEGRTYSGTQKAAPRW